MAKMHNVFLVLNIANETAHTLLWQTHSQESAKAGERLRENERKSQLLVSKAKSAFAALPYACVLHFTFTYFSSSALLCARQLARATGVPRAGAAAGAAHVRLLVPVFVCERMCVCCAVYAGAMA